MSQVERQELEKFRSFYRRYHDDDIARLAQRYPNEQRSLYVGYDELYEFDADLAETYLDKPKDMREIAEEALRTYDLPADVSLGQAHVRLQNLPSSQMISISGIRITDGHIGSLVKIPGTVHEASDVCPQIVEAAFECQRCGTLTYLPQSDDSDLSEPQECLGCEKSGPFRINKSQSEFLDSQAIILRDAPETLPSGETPDSTKVRLEDDIAGVPTAGSTVYITGVLDIERESQSTDYTVTLDAVAVNTDPNMGTVDIPNPSVPVDGLTDYTDAAAVALTDLPEETREEETKAKLVTPLIEALGWNKFDNSEVRLEYTDSKTDSRPDYVLFGPDDTPKVVVEAKSLGTRLNSAQTQVCDYLRIYSAEYGLLTDGRELHFYDNSHLEGDPKKIASLGYGDFPDSDVIGRVNRDEFY